MTRMADNATFILVMHCLMAVSGSNAAPSMATDDVILCVAVLIYFFVCGSMSFRHFVASRSVKTTACTVEQETSIKLAC